MKFLCWSYTIVELSACKTRGHIRTFQRYFDSLTQKSLSAVVDHNNHCQSVDFGCCMTGQHPGLRKYWRSSHYAEKDDLLYSLDGGRKAFFVHWSVHQWWKMRQNQWLELPYWYAASQNEQILCRRQTRFSGKRAAKSLLAAEKVEMHDPTWSQNHMSEDFLLQFMHEAAKEHATPLISSISFRFPKRWLF